MIYDRGRTKTTVATSKTTVATSMAGKWITLALLVGLCLGARGMDSLHEDLFSGWDDIPSSNSPPRSPPPFKPTKVSAAANTQAPTVRSLFRNPFRLRSDANPGRQSAYDWTRYSDDPFGVGNDHDFFVGSSATDDAEPSSGVGLSSILPGSLAGLVRGGIHRWQFSDSPFVDDMAGDVDESLEMPTLTPGKHEDSMDGFAELTTHWLWGHKNASPPPSDSASLFKRLVVVPAVDDVCGIAVDLVEENNFEDGEGLIETCTTPFLKKRLEAGVADSVSRGAVFGGIWSAVAATTARGFIAREPRNILMQALKVNMRNGIVGGALGGIAYALMMVGLKERAHRHAIDEVGAVLDGSMDDSTLPKYYTDRRVVDLSGIYEKLHDEDLVVDKKKGIDKYAYTLGSSIAGGAFGGGLGAYHALGRTFLRSPVAAAGVSGVIAATAGLIVSELMGPVLSAAHKRLMHATPESKPEPSLEAQAAQYLITPSKGLSLATGISTAFLVNMLTKGAMATPPKIRRRGSDLKGPVWSNPGANGAPRSSTAGDTSTSAEVSDAVAQVTEEEASDGLQDTMDEVKDAFKDLSKIATKDGARAVTTELQHKPRVDDPVLRKAIEMGLEKPPSVDLDDNTPGPVRAAFGGNDLFGDVLLSTGEKSRQHLY